MGRVQFVYVGRISRLGHPLLLRLRFPRLASSSPRARRRPRRAPPPPRMPAPPRAVRGAGETRARRRTVSLGRCAARPSRRRRSRRARAPHRRAPERRPRAHRRAARLRRGGHPGARRGDQRRAPSTTPARRSAPRATPMAAGGARRARPTDDASSFAALEQTHEEPSNLRGNARARHRRAVRSGGNAASAPRAAARATRRGDLPAVRESPVPCALVRAARDGALRTHCAASEGFRRPRASPRSRAHRRRRRHLRDAASRSAAPRADPWTAHTAKRAPRSPRRTRSCVRACSFN